MPTKIKLKKSGATGNVPSNVSLDYGELAINYADGILYFKNASNVIQQISGVTANSFETINANGTLLIADSNTDILTIAAGSGINITANGISDALTISARLNDTVTSTDTLQSATANAVKTAYDQATNAYTQANNSGNTVQVYANSGSVLSNKSLNFVNTSTVIVSIADSGDGNANISFTSGGGSLSNIRVSQNSTGTINANGFNFVNSSSVTVSVTPGIDGNANITFTSLGGGSGSSIVESDVFTANGSQNTFTLTRSTVTDKAFVYISGVSQIPGIDYQVNSNILSLNVAPANGTSIEVRSLVDTPIINVSSFLSDKFTANGIQTVFGLSGEPYSSNGVFVFIDGVTQVPVTDYSVSSNTVVFTTAPDANAIVEVRSVIGVQVLQNQNNEISLGNTSLEIFNSQYAFTSGGFSTQNDSIARTYILRGTTTNNVESELFLDNANTRISVPTNTTVFYTADIVGRRTDASGESSGFHIKGVVDNFSGTVADVGDLYEVVVAEDDPSLLVDARADDTNNTINIYVTGATGKTIRWTALVKTVEVAQ